MTDRNELIADLGKIAADIFTEAVAGLADDKKIALSEALLRGAELRLIYAPSRATVLVSLHSPDPTVKPQAVCTIVGDLPTETEH